MKKSDEYWKWHGTPNCKCVVCGKDMYVRPNRIKRVKHGITCSKKCDSVNRSLWFRGKENHQFGLKEDLNSSFKSWEKTTHYGYIKVHKKEHPFCDCNGFVFKHRLIVEENAENYDSKYFVEINGKKYLKPIVEVHHINENKKDNRIENLMPLTKEEHISLHNKLKEIIRNEKNGRILAIKRVANKEKKNGSN